jgi:site-specific DNA recombinase
MTATAQLKAAAATASGLRAAIYVRLSEDRTGEGEGVERQLDACKTLAELRGINVVAVFSDNDISAYSGKKRPGFEKLMAAIARGEIDTIIVWHPDRLYRRVKDLLRITESGVSIVSVTGGDLDLSTPTGRMVATILGSVAQQEVEHKGERQVVANEQRRTKGRWQAAGVVPFGYAKIGTKHNYRLERAEPAATLIQTAVTDILRGVSLGAIAADWNRRGATTIRQKRPWSSFTVRQLVMNPIYAGLVAHKDQIVRAEGVPVEGDWEALIDTDTHHELVAYLSNPKRRSASSTERKHLGSGLYVCGICGGKLYSASPGKGRLIYGCRALKHLGRVAEPLDEYVESVVLNVLSASDIRKHLSTDASVDLDALHNRRVFLENKLSAAAVMHAKDQMTDAQFIDITAERRAQLADVNKALGEAVAEQTSSAAMDLVDKADGSRDKLVEAWNASATDIKGRIISELCTVVVRPTGRTGRSKFNPAASVDLLPKPKVAPIFTRLAGHGELTATAYAKTSA